jgi:hypothetical protein
LGASKIRRGDNSGAFRKFSEILRRALKRKPDRRDLQHRMREHFVRNFEREITFPDRLFRGSGEPKAKFAELVDVHRCSTMRGSEGDPTDEFETHEAKTA